MNILGSIARFFAGGDHVNRDPADDFWYQQIGVTSLSNQVVTPATAQSLSTVRACLKCLSDPLASLPIIIFQRQANGAKRRLDDHPVARLLREAFTDRLTASVARGTLQWHLGIYSNAYAEIGSGADYEIGKLTPIHPDLVTPERSPGGDIFYKVRDPQRAGERVIHESGMFHLRTWPLDDGGVCGVPLIADAKNTIGKALALQQYASRYFVNDAQAGGIIEYPKTFAKPEDRRAFLAAWREFRSGMNAHKDGVLENGAKYNRAQINNEQAQFLETQKQCAVDIAQLWLIPPHKIGLLDKATFSNIEQQSLEFVTQTLLPWLVAWEQAIKAQLIMEPDVFVEFNVAGLLRGDLKARYEAYAIGRSWGWLSANDVRALENMNPLDDGDDYLMPLNMKPVGEPAPEPEPEQGDGDQDPNERALAIMGKAKGQPNAYRRSDCSNDGVAAGDHGRNLGDYPSNHRAEVIRLAGAVRRSA